MDSPPQQEGETSWTIRGKSIIVTGANTGIGKETALELVRRGAAKVILACRNLKAAEEAAADIRQKARIEDSPGIIVVRHLDLASLDSVRKFADDINETEPRIDVLINNAGIKPAIRQVTEDGFEVAFQTNYLSQALLTNLLLELLKKSAPSRIIAVSSDAYKFTWPGGLKVDDLQIEKRSYSSWDAYGQSKLAFLLYCRKLSDHLLSENCGVSVFSVHPGLVLTGIIRNDPDAWQFFVRKVCGPLGIVTNCKNGALTTLYCACKPDIEKYSGGYFSNSKHISTLAVATDNAKADKLWELSEQYWKKGTE